MEGQLPSVLAPEGFQKTGVLTAFIFSALVLGVERYLHELGKDIEEIKTGQEEIQNGEC